MMPQFQGGEEELDLTRTGMVMGTPYYMSPEQARGERNLDGRVDVYACGVMMYEAIVGKRPFLAPNYNALLLAIINTKPKPLREVRPATPAAMEAIVVHMMAKARDDRYASAKAALRDLQALPVAASHRANRIAAPPTDGATRLDIRIKNALDVEDVPTQIFRPGMHPTSGAPMPRPESETVEIEVEVEVEMGDETQCITRPPLPRRR